MKIEGKNIVIIGAGFGGLSAAAYLAKAGHNVTVLEKNRNASAQSHIIKKKGFTFDLNPDWYLLPEVFDDFFRDFGTSAHEQYDVAQIETSFRLFTSETDYDVTAWPDIGDLYDALEPGSGKRLNKLLHKAEKQYSAFHAGLSTGQTTPKPPHILKPAQRKSYHQTVAKAIKNQDLQHLLDLPVLMMGGNPATTPGAFGFLAYSALGLGLTQPVGGMGSITAAMQKIAKKAGAKINYSSPVTKIIAEEGVIRGVEVKGEVFSCDTIVSNADMRWVETVLLEPPQQSYPEKYWQKRDYAPARVVACLGVGKELPELQQHNVLADIDWDESLAQLFDKKAWSPKPPVFIENASKLNAKLAPKGMENVVLHIPIAAGLDPSDQQLERLILSVIGRLQEQLGYEFMKDIVTAEIKAHDYFSEAFNNFDGSMNGLSPTLAQITSQQPSAKSSKLNSLYYIGDYSTPGNMPALAVANGKAIASRI